MRKLSLMFAVAAALLFPVTTFAGQHHDHDRHSRGHWSAKAPFGFRSCRICVFRHPELITGQTIKARHLCLMSSSTETWRKQRGEERPRAGQTSDRHRCPSSLRNLLGAVVRLLQTSRLTNLIRGIAPSLVAPERHQSTHGSGR